jgi:hypothetical protein
MGKKNFPNIDRFPDFNKKNLEPTKFNYEKNSSFKIPTWSKRQSYSIIFVLNSSIGLKQAL